MSPQYVCINGEFFEQGIKMKSFDEKLTPSEDFTLEQYSLYLQYASAIELEKDYVSKETYNKMLADYYFYK